MPEFHILALISHFSIGFTFWHQFRILALISHFGISFGFGILAFGYMTKPETFRPGPNKFWHPTLVRNGDEKTKNLKNLIYHSKRTPDEKPKEKKSSVSMKWRRKRTKNLTVPLVRPLLS